MRIRAGSPSQARPIRRGDPAIPYPRPSQLARTFATKKSTGPRPTSHRVVSLSYPISGCINQRAPGMGFIGGCELRVSTHIADLDAIGVEGELEFRHLPAVDFGRLRMQPDDRGCLGDRHQRLDLRLVEAGLS
jgi:hypothetical protein